MKFSNRMKKKYETTALISTLGFDPKQVKLLNEVAKAGFEYVGEKGAVDVALQLLVQAVEKNK